MDQRHLRPNGMKVSDLQAEFIEWLLDPNKQGSQNEFARQHNVAVSTLSNWKKKDAIFKTEWERRAAELNVSTDRIQAVIEAIYQSATNSDAKEHVKAATLYLQYVDKFTPKLDMGVTKKDQATSLEEMTDEELQEALQAEWRARKGQIGPVPTDVLDRLDYYSAGGTG